MYVTMVPDIRNGCVPRIGPETKKNPSLNILLMKKSVEGGKKKNTSSY